MVKSKIIPMTKEEMNKLLEVVKEEDFWYMLFKVAKTTGRRLGEYYDVQIKDINIEEKFMLTKKKEKIILNEELLTLIKKYIDKNKLKNEDYLFRKVGYRQIQNKIKIYSKKAGIEHNVVFHNFRHYLVRELAKSGLSYYAIAKITGHTSVGTLVFYEDP